ncbi:uncharacterized protein N7443_010922 [Penicillium atrosanguineum]|uniref:uncharacterized protein n=1 Tax=Penicillium atrosanguineum TaxID=1132637 RepID=UPI0023926D93|nr:uncharacterized protein N7443_010922 [Penicillium atrosanguineum]KAJ5290669.1 hypothetical protein N7443_010922 [Penicillium atrosanguineum]
MSRRVVSRVISLEPLHVIRAKDKRARELALSRRDDSDLASAFEPEQSTAETVREEKPSKKPSDVNNDPMSALSTESAYDSSRLANIAHETGATKHAIPNAPHPMLNATSAFASSDNSINANATNATSSADAAPPSKLIFDTDKEDSNAIKIQNMQQASVSNDVESSSKGVLIPGIRGKEKLPEPSKRDSAFSRPRRSTRKSYTLLLEPDVDWDEDLRPTDDEMEIVDDHGETALTSPDPEYRNSTDRKSPKRKKRQSGPNSSKRRKGVKDKTSPVPKGGDRDLQLSLTSAPITFSQTQVSGSHTGSSSRPLDGRSEAATTKDTAKIPKTSFPGISEDQNQYHSQVAVEKHEVIEISSDSSSSSKKPSLDYDINPQSNHVSPTFNLNQGRGKVVGMKLSDALRDAGEPFRHTDDPATHPTGIFETAIDNKDANVSTSRKPLARISPFRNSEVTESSIDQGQVESDSNRLASDSRMIRADYLNLPVTTNLHGLFNDQADIKINEKTDDTTHAMMDPAMKSTGMVHEKLVNSQEYSQFTGSKADTLSQSSSAAKADRQATFTIHENQSQNTPESEKPLLTKETPLESRPRWIPRSILVDRNGSPRLANQGDKNIQTPFLIDERMGSIDLTGVSSSSSDYDQSSEMYSPGYTPESQRTWSKFHRDMVAEFGINTEQLLHDGDRPTSLSKAFVSETARCGTSHTDRQYTEKLLETRPMITPQRADDTSAGTRTYIDHERTSTIAATFSTDSTDEVGLCGRDRAHDRLGDPSLSRTSGPSYPGLEPSRSLVQDDANGVEWISALQTAQRSAHDLLQQLSTQLAAEQDTIRDVLQIYRTGCHRILDDLFRAQEVRMELYRQQMSSVKEQHTQICRELIRGLQELDDRVQGP